MQVQPVQLWSLRRCTAMPTECENANASAAESFHKPCGNNRQNASQRTPTSDFLKLCLDVDASSRWRTTRSVRGVANLHRAAQVSGSSATYQKSVTAHIRISGIGLERA